MKSSSVSRFFLFFALRLSESAGVADEITGDEVVDMVGDALGNEEGPATTDWSRPTLGGAEPDRCPLMWSTDDAIPGVPGLSGAGECLCSCCIEASEA